jgi:hypothetical protein
MVSESVIREVRKAAYAHEARRKWSRAFATPPVMDESFSLKDDVRAALERFRDERPFTLTGEKYIGACSAVVRLLALAYGLPEPSVFHIGAWKGPATFSEYVERQHAIVLQGKASVLALLHTFMHARGYGEHAALWWSLNTFRLVWPTSFARFEKHTSTKDGILRFLCARCTAVHEAREMHARTIRPRNTRIGTPARDFIDMTPPDPRVDDNYDPFDAASVFGVRKIDLTDPVETNETNEPDPNIMARFNRLELD